MLNSTHNILQHWPIISATVMASASEINIGKLKVVLIEASFDALLVCGITFFSTLVAVGHSEFIESAKIAGISAFVSGGLSFFTEIKKSEPEILNCENSNIKEE
jgi:hypothetical protein